MPTRPCTTLLLALAVWGASVGISAGADVVVPNSEFARIRGGASSSGPRGMRHVDTFVEPATFQSLGVSRPLPPPKSAVADALQATEEKAPAELMTTAPALPLAVEPAAPLPDQPASEPAVQAEPVEVVSSPADVQPSASVAASDAQPAPLKVASRIDASQTDSSPGRLLMGSSAASDASHARVGRPSNPLDAVMNWRPSSQQMTATGAGLAITIGLLLSFVWLIRSMAPKSSRQLPREVVEVLGRAPLGGKQTTQLVRVGHKLVLIAITPEGAETLTEITDPVEVARLVAACDTSSGRGSIAEFDAMLRQMEGERTRPGFLDTRDDYRYDEASFDPRSLAAAYANTPGGRGDG